jgi:hypothetical protein
LIWVGRPKLRANHLSTAKTAQDNRFRSSNSCFGSLH